METTTIPPHGNTKYDFAGMEVGGKILIEEGKRNSAATAANNYVKKIKKERKLKKDELPKFTVRASKDGSLWCYRIK